MGSVSPSLASPEAAIGLDALEVVARFQRPVPKDSTLLTTLEKRTSVIAVSGFVQRVGSNDNPEPAGNSSFPSLGSWDGSTRQPSLFAESGMFFCVIWGDSVNSYSRGWLFAVSRQLRGLNQGPRRLHLVRLFSLQPSEMRLSRHSLECDVLQ